MAEFNLIPREYHDRRMRRRTLIVKSTAVFVVLAAFFSAVQLAEQQVVKLEQEAHALREKKAVSAYEQRQISQLRKYEAELNGQVLLLNSLGQGAPVAELVRTIEQAVQPVEVSFSSWHFRRGGIEVAEEKEARPPSYYAVGKKLEEFPETWRSLTLMTVNGSAKDHAALSKFVQNLFRHPDVDDVRVQRSTQSTVGVQFNLAIVVKTEVASS